MSELLGNPRINGYNMRGLGKLLPEDLELFRKRRLQECLIKVGDMGEVR